MNAGLKARTPRACQNISLRLAISTRELPSEKGSIGATADGGE